MDGNAVSSLSVYDEAALCSNAFKSVSVCPYLSYYPFIRILRGLVHTWIYEVSAHQNYYADLQLQHFYR